MDLAERQVLVHELKMAVAQELDLNHRVAVLRPRDGDLVAILAKTALRPEQVEYMGTALKKLYPNVSFIVLDAGADLALVQPPNPTGATGQWVCYDNDHQLTMTWPEACKMCGRLPPMNPPNY